jgi:hypothetical protein
LLFRLQLEDSEFAKTAALKAKQNLELELSDVQQQLDDVMRSKSDLEDRILRMSREKADLSGQVSDLQTFPNKRELKLLKTSKLFQSAVLEYRFFNQNKKTLFRPNYL